MIGNENIKYVMVLTRILDAPHDLVWKAWTQPRHLAKWWGPKGFTNPVCEINLKLGGKMKIHMRKFDGTLYPMEAVFKEIIPGQRLVFESTAFNPEGQALFDILNTITFTPKGKQTEITIKAQVLRTTSGYEKYLEGQEIGWNQSLDRLAELLGRKGEDNEWN